MATFKELLEKVEDPELKASLTTEFTKVNTERGEFGNKLILKDNELNALKEDKQKWGDAFATLKKHGIEPDKIPAILEKMNISKTQEEEYELTKVALGEKDKTLSELQKKVKRFEAEKVIDSRFEKARVELKDAKGQPIKLSDTFIDKEKLYDVADLSNETVLTDKINSVLSEAVTKQTETLRDIGFMGTKVHGAHVHNDGDVKQVLDIKEIMEKHGPEAAIGAARALASQK